MQLGFLHNYLYSGFSGRAEFVGFKIEEVDNTLAANTNVLGDLYANRFIDRNDGAFFIDPADGGFNVRGGSGNRVTLSTNDSGFRVQNAEGNGVSDVRLGAAWGRPGIYSNTYLSLMSGGTYIEFVTGNSQHGYIDNGANLFAFGSMRSPIFYDNNNTGFYFDGASDSQFNTGTFQGRMRYSNYLVSNNEGGLMGNYNVTGTASKLIWTIGESWPIGNMYGLGYEYASSTYLPGDPHVIALRNNGTTYTRLQMNGGIYTTGAIFSTVAMYTPIYYDSNNTAFFLDPTGTSNLGGLTLAANVSTGRGSYGSGTANLVLLSDATYGRATIDFRSGVNYPSDGAQIYYETATNLSSGETSRLVIRTENDADDSILIRGGFVEINSTTVDGGSTNPGFRVLYNGNARMYTYSDNTTEFGSFRAPIFYDSNNTAFFTDPAGRSRLSSLDYGDGGYFFTGGDWGWRHQTPFGWIQFGPANSSHAHIYTSLSNFYLNAPIQVNGVSIMNTNDIRTRIFYDVDNTTYYGDFASTSRMNAINMGYVGGQVYLNAAQGTLFFNANGEGDIQGYSIGTTLENYNGNYTKLTLDWHTGIRIGAASTYGGIRFYNNSVKYYGGSQVFSVAEGDNHVRVNNILFVSGDARAPIFYDQNNTGFYLDPNGFSNLNSVNISTLQGRGTSLLMYYEGFTLNADTMSANSTGFTYAVNAPYVGPIIRISEGGYSLWLNAPYSGGGFGLAFRTRNGDSGTLNPWRYPAVYGVNANGGGDLYATIYYDQNDTGYYIDPNGTSNLNRFTDRTKVAMGMTGRYNSPRFDFVGGDTNYWVGSMGWGNNDFNTMMNWGSGFIDTWSNPANQPSGTSHWVGVQAYHGSFGYNSAYGWQLVGGPIGNLRFRQSWPGSGAWRTVPMLDVNDGNGGAMYAGIYYDTNDTAYFLDPASNARLTDVRLNRLGYPGSGNAGDGFPYARFTEAWGIQFSSPDTRWTLSTSGAFLAGFISSGTDWGSGRVLANNDMRAPIFYDWNDTGWYIDPNGYSNLNSANVSLSRYGTSGDVAQDFRNTPAGTMRHYGDHPNLGSSPGGTWWFYDNYRHSNGSSFWGIQVAWGWEDQANRLATRNVTGNNFGSWVYYLNSNNFTSYAISRGGDTVSGLIYFLTNNGGQAVNNSNSAALQAYSTGNNSAFMSFHKGGHYAINMGLDNDNVFRIGGWSASGNRLQMDMSGNLTMAGNVTAFSDVRLKGEIETVTEALDKITQLRGVTYIRTDKDAPEGRQMGVIAQEIMEVIPEVVTKDSSGMYNVAYGNLAGLFIESIKELKSQLDEARNEIKELRQELLKK
jgi:hypothetical protein